LQPIIFKYRSRKLCEANIATIKALIDQHCSQGRSYISRELYRKWSWIQPNGKLKEYAARDFLLRLEEQKYIKLPPRKCQKNNLKPKDFSQKPIFIKRELKGTITEYGALRIQEAKDHQDHYLWDYLLHHYHYLGSPKLVGEHIRHIVRIDNQVVACLGWASAAWKVKDRDCFIGWDESCKRIRLHFLANNVRFLIPPWIRIKYLATRALSLSIRRLSSDWQPLYGHPLFLAETFVDTARFKGTCYKTANWLLVGKTKGSAKRGNTYQYHGQPKDIYIYPLHKDFRRFLLHDEG
jgi:hypothetical protein